MGNCQAAEAASVVLHHQGSKIERIYRSVSAQEIMSSNPGYYVALVVTSASAENGPPLKQLKLLRPDDTLRIGQVYRLISFEEVLKEFAAKKCVKLGRLPKEKEGHSGDKRKERGGSKSSLNSVKEELQEVHLLGSSSNSYSSGVGRQNRHWRPALQSIAEVAI